MRAVRGKNGLLTLISTVESRIYDIAETQGFIAQTSLDERSHHIADQLHQQNVLRKVKRGEQLGYTTYREKLS
jgi:hypothetical protein